MLWPALLWRGPYRALPFSTQPLREKQRAASLRENTALHPWNMLRSRHAESLDAGRSPRQRPIPEKRAGEDNQKTQARGKNEFHWCRCNRACAPSPPDSLALAGNTRKTNSAPTLVAASTSG